MQPTQVHRNTSQNGARAKIMRALYTEGMLPIPEICELCGLTAKQSRDNLGAAKNDGLVVAERDDVTSRLANCADGFAAAWVVRKAFLGDVEFHAGVYGEAPPDVQHRDVFIVDFSYSRDTLLAMIRDCASMTILDHHQTAKSHLTDLPGAITRFELGLSGAMIAWQYFFCGQTPPRLLQHIQDRDLWLFHLDLSGAMIAWQYFFCGQMPPRLLQHIQDRDLWLFHLDATREVMAGLFSYPYDFGIYELWMSSSDLSGLASDGAAILRKQKQDLDHLLPKLTQYVRIAGKLVPVANVPHIMASDAGARLAIGQPFAATYWDGPKGRMFSLRSTKPSGDDCAAIAETYGGGGHRHAPGFLIPGSMWEDQP